ncbi:MAG: hypothetical protein C5B50_24935 [Verrucomicrobia bacterium]|nr:MAG: hypothetical protein C5B50_24935 [Verrucomicrobiota bacterium]
MQGFVSLHETPIEILDKSYPPPWWASADFRQIAVGPKKCYRLLSFPSRERSDNRTLAKGGLVQIQKRFLANPEYQRSEWREALEWQAAFEDRFNDGRPLHDYLWGFRKDPLLDSFRYSRRNIPPLKTHGTYLPPDAWFLELVSPDHAKATIRDAFGKSADPANPGIAVYRVSFSNDAVIHLRELEPCEAPGSLLAEWAAWQKKHGEPDKKAEIAMNFVNLGLSPVDALRLVQGGPSLSSTASPQCPPPPAPPPPKPESPPEYFTSRDEAAKYAGITTRTLRNWIACDWLKAEQNGRKFRVARSDLDKCKQNSKRKREN